MFIYFWERQREIEYKEGRTRERGRRRIWSRLQALSCRRGAWCGAWTHELWDHDLSRSRTLNRLRHPGAPSLLFLKKIFNVYFEGERDREWAGEGQRERGRRRIWSRLQALSCWHRAWRGARTQEPWDHDLSWSQMLNQLSHPGVPSFLFLNWKC